METTFNALDTIWVLLGAILVFWMQAGFAMVESGFTRAKNAGNIIMKNLMDFVLGTIIYWVIGFGIMMGPDILGVIGKVDFFIRGNYDSAFPTMAFVIFQTVFCATAATIVSGAMAERTKFISYLIYSAVISAVIYPISGHWIWGGGWLSQLGFHDFAGSTAVHMVGGVAALVGAKILGPRIGKYDKDGKSKAIPGHNIAIGALGVFILWMGWFGFNGCSTVAMSTDEAMLSASSVFVTTNMAAAAATLMTLIVTWVRYGKPDVSMTLNGALAGLVAITAGCDMVSPVGAFFIGAVAGTLVVFAVEFIDHKLKIDDPVGAIAVHGCCGATGTLLTGLFALDGGLFYGGGTHMFLIQLLGVVSVAVYVLVTMFIVFKLIQKTVGLRASEEEEILGLDITEHGLVSSYADFAPAGDFYYSLDDEGSLASVTEPVPPANIEDVLLKEKDSKIKVTKTDTGISKITIVINKDKFNSLKAAMQKVGVTGMTVTNVLGCGVQKGRKSYYRGSEVDAVLLPKLKVEIVVAAVPVRTVIEAAKKALYTGNIGDGKIFIYGLDNVVKIRTGEEGFDALQEPEEE
ncbi:ammonium transporter [Anaerofustis stercorihominis]|uniref:ammonium transporter n=1 Tax=Anaerofustis stercorihominis TaxID=214853 RepID=UPI00214B941F|nr:ammonium transporter [Anaerofustis stercorihominis]MCR2032574.1 ammonium transporter [Anaerofustis stercorihominis]